MKGEIILDFDDDLIHRKRKEKLLSELDGLDYDEPVTTISGNRPTKTKQKKTESEKIEEQVNYDDWLDTVAEFRAEPIKRKRRNNTDIFGIEGGKKKKKKKKKDGELTDYHKEFEHEEKLIQDLMVQQSKFTDSLQKKYDALEGTKSSARGVGKFTTDLIESINAGRNLELALIKEKVSLKKTIADLSMKEKKEFGKADVNDDDLSLYSSSLLKKMIGESAQTVSDRDIGISEEGLDEMFQAISEEVGFSEDDDELDKYLKYESSDVTVYACIEDSSNGNEGRRYFLAKDAAGNIIDDYPLPDMTELGINRSTDVATDIYSRKYPIIWI